MRSALLPAFLVAAGCAAGGTRPPVPLDPPGLPPGRAAEPPAGVAPVDREWFPVDAATVEVLAGERSLDVRAVRAAQEGAEAAADQAGLALWPSLRPHARFYRLEGLTQGTDGTFEEVEKQNETAGSGVVLDLDAVAARARILASRRRRDAAGLASEAARRAAVLEAEERLDDLLASQNEIAIAREALEGFRAAADFERSREASGAGLRADRMVAEAREEEARGDVIRAGQAFRDASARLATSLHVDPRTTLFVPDPEVPTLRRVPDLADLGALVAEALARRPEIGEAVLLAEASGEEASAARAAPFVPRLVASADLDGFGPTFGRLQERRQYAVGLEWTLALEDLGKDRGARARVERADVETARRRQAVVEAVVRNREALRAAGEAVESARKRLEASLEAERLVSERRRAGSALLVEELEARRQVGLARRGLLSALLARNRADRRLAFALGR